MVQGIGNPSTAITCSSSEQIQASTIIMFIVLIFIIFAQTVIMILVLLCSFALRRTAKNPKVHRNMRQAHFRENNVDIPLEDTIENHRYTPTDMIMQKADDPDGTSISMCENMD